jgi:2-hydroxychromene-2-carboxylate isomerase
MIEIEAFFDCACVWAYLARAHVRRSAAPRENVMLRWRPVLSAHLFDEVNPVARAPLPPVKEAYYEGDLRLWADYLGCSFAAVLPGPADAVDCMRACIAAQRWDRLDAFADAAFAAAWARGEDLADRALLARLWTQSGLPTAMFAEPLDWPGVDAELRANARELAARGGFETPTFLVGEDLFFGNDAMPLLEKAVTARLKANGYLVAG